MADTPESALLTACRYVMQDIQATGSFRVTATTTEYVRSAIEMSEQAAKRWVYCRHAHSSFWHWAFLEGTRGPSDLGKEWEPVGIVLGRSMAEAVQRGRMGELVEDEQDTEAGDAA